MKEKIRWGILSTGNIAKKFVTGLKVVKDAEIVAVGSRTKGAAESFGNAFEIPPPPRKLRGARRRPRGGCYLRWGRRTRFMPKIRSFA